MAAAGVWWFSRPSDSVVFPLEKFTLANGLTVGLSPDHASPTFTLAAAYRARGKLLADAMRWKMEDFDHAQAEAGEGAVACHGDA